VDKMNIKNFQLNKGYSFRGHRGVGFGMIKCIFGDPNMSNPFNALKLKLVICSNRL
jgi:hypothetical protein